MFDPHAYYSIYVERLSEGDLASSEPRKPKTTFQYFQLSQVYNFYSTLKSAAASEKRLHVLEFGGGPSAAALISAAPYAERMVFSDFVERNRQFVDLWRNQKDFGHDFQKVIKHVVQSIEMKGHDEAERREKELRDKLDSVLHCDILQDLPIQDAKEVMYDVVSAHLCLCTACETVDTYGEGMRKLAALIRPGGYILGSDVLGGSFYKLGDVQFHCTVLTKDDVHQALLNAGLGEDVSFFSMPMEGSPGVRDGKEFLVYSAKKV